MFFSMGFSFMELIKWDTWSLDYSSYIPMNPSFHFIFHVLFHAILHYRAY